MKLKAKRLILFVKDVPTVAAFYRDVLGLKMKSDPADKKWADLETGAFSLGIHHGGNVNSVEKAPKLAFHCDDVAEARSILLERGAKLGPVKTFGDLQLCDGKDPEGNPFQLSNRA